MTASLLIQPDGTVTDVHVTPGSIGTHLGCRNVDVVALTQRLDMWIGDESLFTDPVNPIATALARRHGFVWQNYHGPVLLCGTTAAGGSTDLELDQLRALLTHLADVDV